MFCTTKCPYYGLRKVLKGLLAEHLEVLHDAATWQWRCWHENESVTKDQILRKVVTIDGKHVEVGK